MKLDHLYLIKCKKNSLAFFSVLLCVLNFILSLFPYFVYADVSGVDFSQAYIYDMLQQEMTEETPFVNKNREDFKMIFNGLEAEMAKSGYTFAGAGSDSIRGLNSTQAKNLVDYSNKAKSVYDSLAEPDSDILGEIRYYKGEPYYCDTKNARFFRLTDDMKNELSESDKKELLNIFCPTANEFQRESLYGRINENSVNTLLYYTGEVPQAMSDLIDMYKENTIPSSDYSGLGVNGSSVNYLYDPAQNITWSTSYTKGYNYGTVRPLVFMGSWVHQFPTSSNPNVYAMYWRGAVDGGYWCVTSGRNIGYNPRMYVYKPIEVNYTQYSSYYGYKIGEYGNSYLPFKGLNFKGCISDNSVYDWDNVVEPTLDRLNDDVADTWDNNPFGYVEGANENGLVKNYDSQGNVTNNYYYIYSPNINYIYNFNINIGGGGDSGGDNGGGGSGGGGEGGGGSGGGDTPSVSFPWHFDVAVPVEIQVPADIPDVDIEPELPQLEFDELKYAFPFCIPFDIWYSLSYFVDPDALPVFDVPFHIEYQGTTICDYQFHLDLRDYGINQIVFYLRAVQVVGFVMFLCYLTFKPKT